MSSASVDHVQAILTSYGRNGDVVHDPSSYSIKPWSKTSTHSKYHINHEVDSNPSDANDSRGGYIVVLGERNFLESVADVLQLPPESIPRPSILDKGTTQAHINSPYLLLDQADGKTLSNLASSDYLEHLHRQVGVHLKSLHEVQNDWFGLPTDASEWSNCYSWSECFTLLIERAIDTASAAEPRIITDDDIGDLRRCLSRAIAFYVFDDVEVPSLVWCPSLDWERLVTAKEARSNGEDIKVTGLSGWEGAIWGDPLMEGAFAKPSAALMEGYSTDLILLPRHRTKRLWYTVFAAVTALVNSAHTLEELEGAVGGAGLKQILMESIAQLRSAQ